jgi:hypothetical protein
MRNIVCDNTFSAIRQLPLEVEYAGLEQWVLQQPVTPARDQRLRTWLRNMNLWLLVAMVITFTAGTAIYQGNNNFLLSRNEPLAAHSLSSKNAVTTAVASANSINTNHEVIKNNKRSHPYSGKTITAITHRKENIPPLPYPVPKDFHPQFLQPAEILKEISTQPCEDPAPARTIVITSGYCTFAKDDEWIKTFIRELVTDRIIIDSVGLRFTLTAFSFIINGNTQEEITVTKYNDLYKTATGQELKSTDSVSLSVGESSCTLSKTLDQ